MYLVLDLPEFPAHLEGWTGIGGTSDLPLTPDAFSTAPSTGDGRTFFVSVFDKGRLLYSSYFGGTTSICIPPFCGFVVGLIRIAPHVSSGAVYLGGTTANPNMPVTPGAFQPTYPGGFNSIFAARLTLPDFGAATASTTSRHIRR